MRVQIRRGWDGAGRSGRTIGPSKKVGNTAWTPVLWDGQEDPDFFKSSGLEESPEQKSLGQIAYESDPRGGQQNFGPWHKAIDLVRSIHETMAKAVEKEVLKRHKIK